MIQVNKRSWVDTCIISALPFATPEATVPIPASPTSFTDTLALGLTFLFSRCQRSLLSVWDIHVTKEIQDAAEDYLMKVIDQLGKILNRINVVMRRWRYKWNTRFRISQPCNVCTNFFPRQLASFPWLCTLCNFDFQLISIGQECWSYTKPAWSNLKKMKWESLIKKLTIISARAKIKVLSSFSFERGKLINFSPITTITVSMHFHEIKNTIASHKF